MNPARLHALFNTWFQPKKRQADHIQTGMVGGKSARYVDFDHPQTEGRSLAEYFMKG